MRGGFSQVIEMPTATYNTRSLGIQPLDAQNDRGDEINLDELNSYIGGGAPRRF